MTGFGASSREEGDLVLSVEVRSVNHRHLLVKVRLTSELSFLEGDVENLVKKRLERGSVTVNLTTTRARSSEATALRPEVLVRYHEELTALAERLGIEGSVPLQSLLSLPGVVASPETVLEDSAGLHRGLFAAVEEAIERMVEMRETEGRAIAVDLAKHAAATAKIVEKIERRMPQVVRAHQKNIERRVSELLESSQVLSSADVAREVAILADRLDVSEEMSRLRSHLDQLDALIGKGGRVGRKLDFLVQEIFREVNTVGAKCSDAKVAHLVVDAKTHVERLREQVQNVE